MSVRHSTRDGVELVVEASSIEKPMLLDAIAALERVGDLPCSAIDVRSIAQTSFELTLRYSLDAFDGSVNQFLAVLFGDLPYIKLGRIKFQDLRLPPELYARFKGPQFGVEGVVERLHVERFPLLMAILKPSLLPQIDIASFERKLEAPIAGGFHVVKDDEMQGDMPNIRLRERISLAKKHCYVPVINLDDMAEARTLLADGAIRMAMVNASILGFSSLMSLRNHSAVPLLSHLSLLGVYADTFSARLFAFLHRLFGCDAFMTPIGEGGYYRASKEDESEIITALTEELPIKKTLPILTGGARLANLEEIVGRHIRSGVPFGVAMGAQIYADSEGPREMASRVREEVRRIRRDSALAD